MNVTGIVFSAFSAFMAYQAGGMQGFKVWCSVYCFYVMVWNVNQQSKKDGV